MKKYIFFILLFVSTNSLQLFFSGCSKDDPITPQEEHFQAIGVYLHDSGIKMASILRGVTIDTLFAPTGGIGGALNVQFFDENENIINPPTSGQTLTFEIEDTSVAGVFQHPGEEGGFEFHISGKKAGVTNIELFVMHEGHSDFRSGRIPVKVIDQEGVFGEPVGLKLYEEESESLLVTLNTDGSVTGSIETNAGEETSHIEIKFFDENNNESDEYVSSLIPINVQ